MTELDRPTVRWLLRGIALAEVSGVLIVLAALVPGALEPVFELLFARAGSTLGADVATRFSCGIAGAVLTGWAMTMGLIARRLHELSPAVVGNAFALGTLAWFLLDGTVTTVLGAYYNLLGNCIYFALLFFPAWALRSQSRGRRANRVSV